MTGSGASGGGDVANSHDTTHTGTLAADLAKGDELAGRFRIEGLLGIGGMGVVYRAFDLALSIPVAVKVLRSEIAGKPGAFERFRQELLLSRQVSSPHVVRIHDIAQHEGRWLISMDLIDGEPLDKRLDSHGPLPVDEALGIARQIALGLSAAHARKVIHRDLKPSNILIGTDGTAYVSDFGIARSLGTRGMTQTGSVVGTPDYLSPEQARAGPLDGRSDLYALGLILYEMLSGQPAFSGGTQSESLTQRMIGPPPSIRTRRPEVPTWVERLLDRLLRSNPAHRIQSADAVVAAIDKRAVARDFRPGRKSAIMLVAVALVAAVAFLLSRTVPNPATPPAHVPDRVLVLPIENATGDASLADSLAAIDDTMGRQLDANSGVAVIESERLSQAVNQLGMPDASSGELDSSTVLRELPARSLMRVRLSKQGEKFLLTASLTRSSGRTQALRGKASGDLLVAAREFTRIATVSVANTTVASNNFWPTSVIALEAYGQGLRLRRQGLMEAANARFTTATTLDPGYALAWLGTSQAAFQAGRTELAGDAATHGLELAGSNPLASELLALQALSGGDATQAIAAQQARVASHPDDLGARLRLAHLQGHAGSLAPAIKNLRVLLARDAGDPRAWFLLGKFSIMQGESRAAVDEYLVRALVLYKRARNPFGEAETVNAMGVAYSRLGQTNEAAEQFGKAVELRRALDDRRGVASSLRNLAQLAIVQGRFDLALEQLEEAKTLFTSLGDAEGLSAVENELGLLAEERGDFTAAEAAFRRMLRSREQAGDEYGIAESLNNIGFTQFALGDYDSANAFWQQALAAFTRLDGRDDIIRIQQNLGALELARGRWEESGRLLRASLATAERQQMVEETAVSRFYIAQLDHAQGRLGSALDGLARARTLFAERQDQRGLLDTALSRIQVLIDANALAEARKEIDAVAIEGSSSEQRAVLALLRAQIARRLGDRKAQNQALALALPAARASGMQALKMRVDIARNEGSDLDESTKRLGNLSVRLDWLGASMERQLAAHDRAAAATYELARRALRGRGDSIAAGSLHALGAKALRQAGDARGSAAALTLARSEVQRVRASLPPSLQKAYDTYPPLSEAEND